MSTAGRYAFFDFQPQLGDMAAEVLAGLQASPKQVSPKYFYDAEGSGLFEQISVRVR